MRARTANPEDISRWIDATGWTWNELPAAMRAVGLSHIASATAIREWTEGKGALHRDHMVCLARFIEEHPQPGPAAAFMDGIAARARAAAWAKSAEIQKRRDAVEQQRLRWLRENLAKEHKPKVIQRGPLYGLDRDTVRALRGY